MNLANTDNSHDKLKKTSHVCNWEMKISQQNVLYINVMYIKADMGQFNNNNEHYQLTWSLRFKIVLFINNRLAYCCIPWMISHQSWHQICNNSSTHSNKIRSGVMINITTPSWNDQQRFHQQYNWLTIWRLLQTYILKQNKN